MPRQSSGFTGANAIPLGTRNKAIGSKRQFSSSPPRSYNDEPSHKKPSAPEASGNSATIALKAAQAAAANLAKLAQLKKASGGDNGSAGGWNEVPPPPPQQQAPPQQQKPPAPPQQQQARLEDRGRTKKRRSRWGNEKTEIPGMPAAVSANLTPQQQKAYIVQLQIEDITRKLKSGDLGIPPNPEDRSPSPEPIYNGEGKRMNTREYRTRKRLEEERHKHIQHMQEINSDYKPPVDYKPMLQRISERVMIPTEINPNINFVGLLIGPRGNTLKKIEKESNCKIMIRGKGSVKEGKIGRKDGQPLPGEDEPLHALVSSTSVENVQRAVLEIQAIIKQGIEQPEEDNDLRKLQLMELAKLNGTLREDLMPKERAWLKPENQTITNTTVCTKCGGRGHLAQDCRGMHPSENLQQGMGGPGGPGVDRAKMDSEYMSLMAELGEGPPPSHNQGGGPGANRGGRGGFQGNPSRFGGGGNRPWMGGGPRGPPRFGGPPGQRPRFGGPRGGGNMPGGPPMMNQGGPPPPWMQPGPFGPQGGGPNQWGPPPQGPYGNNPGGFNNNNMPGPPGAGGSNSGGGNGGDNPPGEGNMSQNWGGPPGDSNNMMGGGPMGGNMYGGGSGGGSGNGGYMDQNSGGNFYNQPLPPPPGSAAQPPPPPSSGSWQASWGPDPAAKSGDQNSSNNQGPGMMPGMDNSGMGGPGMGYGMPGYGGMGMWGMPPGPVPPPMPTGPGPVPPPPPGGQDGSGMDYGMGMMGGYGMAPPAPPPPPPQ